jgi:phospholipid/cholesterol/gamma-HCH transport system ATP-binding protein
MRKRVALARTIALTPEIVLYDEPTTGLDPPTAAKIAELIRKINTTLKVTSIVVTHDMHTAFTVSDHMVMLRDGVVVLDGTPDVFRTTTDAYVHSFIES